MLSAFQITIAGQKRTKIFLAKVAHKNDSKNSLTVQKWGLEDV
jgi:hypothetical protein